MHPWFKDINWKDVQKRKLKTYKPKIKNLVEIGYKKLQNYKAETNADLQTSGKYYIRDWKFPAPKQERESPYVKKRK